METMKKCDGKNVKKTVASFLALLLVFAFVLSGCGSSADTQKNKGEDKKTESAQKDDSNKSDSNKSDANQQSQDSQGTQGSNGTQGSHGSQDSHGSSAINFDSSAVTAIGDSVMLGAAPKLQELLPGCVVDAKESRQVVKSGEVVDTLRSQNRLGGVVVLALGTNGPFKVSVGQSLLDRVGSDKMIYWVNTYGANLKWQEDSNRTISQLVEANPNVTLIDWAGAAQQHPEWFYNDGLHLKPEGQRAYAQLIYDTIASGYKGTIRSRND